MPKPEVDVIVGKLPPPGKLKPGDEPATDDYSAEEDAAMGVAKALGIDEGQVDVKALCSALRDFNATSSSPEE